MHRPTLVMRVRMILVAVAASYTTLGFSDTNLAGDLAWPVGLIFFMAAIWDLICERRRDRG